MDGSNDADRGVAVAQPPRAWPPLVPTQIGRHPPYRRALVIVLVAFAMGSLFVVSYLDALRPGRKKGRKVDLPVAIVFTKADLLDDGIADPVAFARGNVPGLYGQCEARLGRFSFYASGVAGSTAKLLDDSGAERLVPLRVEPRGIVEPFAWMVGQLGG